MFFYRLSHLKWLMPRPDSCLGWLICSKFTRQRAVGHHAEERKSPRTDGRGAGSEGGSGTEAVVQGSPLGREGESIRARIQEGGRQTRGETLHSESSASNPKT